MRFHTIDIDENFTLTLIKHNWSEIIHLTSLDVHPPLYYFILKCFLSIFTFWTSSFLVKIFTARLLSIIVSIVSWTFLCKISRMLHIKNNLIISWIIFVLLPTLLGYNFLFQQMTNIRMYALAGLFIIIEFYYLLRFRIEPKNRYLIVSILSAILASYTHYYSAMIAGLLLLLYFIKYLLKKNIKDAIKLFVGGISMVISYIPWVSILLNQMNSSSTYWIKNSYLLEQVLVYLFCIILFLYPILIYYKNIDNSIFKEQIFFILIILISMFCFVMIYGYIKHPMFMFRYMYPILLIYEFIGMNTIISLIKYNKYSKKQICYYILIFIILIFNTGISFVHQIQKYNIFSIKSIDNHKIHIYNKKNINEANIPNNKSRFFVYDNFIIKNYTLSNVNYKVVYNNISKPPFVASSSY